MFADQLRAAIEAAPRITLPQMTALLWRAYGEGQVTEAEAEALSALIEGRLAGRRKSETVSHSIGADGPQDRQNGARRPGVGSRPRTDASMERRRRWAASGRLPPGLAARFTPGEIAVLSLVAAEVSRRGDCRMAIEHMAAVSGTSRSTVKNAIREARKLGLVTVEERRVTGFRNDTNIVRILAPEWTSWLRLARRGDPLSNRPGQAPMSRPQGTGVKLQTCTHTQVPNRRESWPADPSKGCRRAAVGFDR